MKVFFNKRSVSWLLMFSMIFNSFVPISISAFENETGLPILTIDYEEEDEESTHHIPHAFDDVETFWGTGTNAAGMVIIGDTLVITEFMQGQNPLTEIRVGARPADGVAPGAVTTWARLTPSITDGVTLTTGGGGNTGNARSFPVNAITIPDVDSLTFVPYSGGKERATVTISFNPLEEFWGATTANDLYIVFERGQDIIDPSIPIEATISAGQALNLAQRIPLDPSTMYIDWQSDDDNIAIVDNDGIVTGISQGSATITATDVNDATHYRTAEITVTPMSANYVQMGWNYVSPIATAWSAMLRAPMDYIIIGENQTLYVGLDMQAQGDLAPIQGAGVGWTNTNVQNWFIDTTEGIIIGDFVRYAPGDNVRMSISIDDNAFDFNFSGQPYEVVYLRPRPTHASAGNWGGVGAFVPATPLAIKVLNPAYSLGQVDDITLNHATYTIDADHSQNLQLNATIDQSGTTISTIVWGSSHDQVATVDQNGLVTAVSGGTATIVARSIQNPEVFATAQITVTGASGNYVPVTGLALSPTTATIHMGQAFYSPDAEPSWWGTPAPGHPFWTERDYSTLLAPAHTLEWVTDRVWLGGQWNDATGTWADTGNRGDTIYVRPGQTTTVSLIYSAENVIQPNTFSTNANHNPSGVHTFWSTPNSSGNTISNALFGSGVGAGNFTSSASGGLGVVGSARGFRSQYQTFGYYFRVVTLNITPTAAVNAAVAADGPQTITLSADIPVGLPGIQADWRPSGHFTTNELHIVVDPNAPDIGPNQPGGNPVENNNNTLRLHATFAPIDATNRNIIWTSSDDTIASVDNAGLVTGHRRGQVTITAIADGNNDAIATATITILNDGSASDIMPDRTITHQFILQHSLDLFAGGTTDYMDAFFYSKPDHLVPGTDEFEYYVARMEDGLNITWSSSNPNIVEVDNSDLSHPNRGILTPIGILPPDIARGYSYATITATVDVNGEHFFASTQVRVYQPNGADIVYLNNISQLNTVPASTVRVLAISAGNLTNANIQTIRSFPNLHELYIIGTATTPHNANAGNVNAGFRGIGFNADDPIDPDPTRGDLRRLVIYNTTHFGNDYFRDSVSLEYLYLRHATFKGTRVVAMPQFSQSSRLHTVRVPQLEHITFRTWYYNTVLSTLELGSQALFIDRPAANAGLWFSFSSLADVMRDVWPDKPYHMTVVVPDYAAFREFTRMEPDYDNPGPFLPGQLNEEIAWVVLPFRTLNGENLPEIETHPPYVDSEFDWLQEYFRVDLPFSTRDIPISLNFFTFAQHLTVQNSWWRPVHYYYQYVESMGGDINNFVIPVAPPGPPSGLTILDVITWAKQAGYDGVDITGYYLEGYQGMRRQTPEEQAHMLHQAREIRRYADLLGIEITGTGFGNSFTDANPERIAMDLDRYKFFMHVADAMGAPVVRVFAGNVPADEIQLGWQHIVDNRLIPVLVELSQYIDANGFDIELGVQNHGDIIATENQALYLIYQLEQLGVTNIGLVQDTGYWRGYQSLQSNFYDWYHAIETTLPISRNFQLKKKPAGAGTAAGWLDLDRVFRDIRRSGYMGTVPIELLWGGSGLDNDLHLSPDPNITWDNIAYWEAQFGRSTAQRVANEAEWFKNLANEASQRSLDSNMDIASVAGVYVNIIPTNRTVTSPFSGSTRAVYGRGTATDPRVREVNVNTSALVAQDIVAAHPGATVTLYDNGQFNNPVGQVSLNAGTNDVYVRIVSANGYMYDFPRDADGNPTWEQELRPGLYSGFITVRRPIVEETFYRINVITPNVSEPPTDPPPPPQEPPTDPPPPPQEPPTDPPPPPQEPPMDPLPPPQRPPTLPQTGSNMMKSLIGASILTAGMIGAYVKNKKKQQKRI